MQFHFTVAQICRAFEPYLLANNKTEKPVRHISLNPDPSDKVSDDRFLQMADQYLKEMGYASQPYIVYKHTDIERTHIHIVTTCVQLDGSKISDSYDHPRSMAACRNLERTFDLTPANDKTQRNEKPIFKPMDYIKGDVKSQMTAVIRYLPKYYSFPNLGTYNALLSLFNVTAEPISGEANGVAKKGLLYFALDAKGEKTGKPFKSSLFGKHTGLESLEMHFEKSKMVMAKHLSRTMIKNSIEAAMHMAKRENDFKKQLLEQGVNVVVRRNNEGRVYGITFIDHESRSVWNGSQLGKNLSANVFNNWWNNGVKIDSDTVQFNKLSPLPINTDGKDPFGFLTPTRNDGALEALGSLLPESQGEDYEEEIFANKMKRKNKRKRN